MYAYYIVYAVIRRNTKKKKKKNLFRKGKGFVWIVYNFFSFCFFRSVTFQQTAKKKSFKNPRRGNRWNSINAPRPRKKRRLCCDGERYYVRRGEQTVADSGVEEEWQKEKGRGGEKKERISFVCLYFTHTPPPPPGLGLGRFNNVRRTRYYG